jgi:hypothetical protein
MDDSTPAHGKVVVLGFYFWYPLAGVTFQFLHYLLGLRDLGYDVYYVEEASNYVYSPTTNDRSPDFAANVRALAPILDAHGFAGRWSFRARYDGVDTTFGMSNADVRQLCRVADALLNVTGWHVLNEDHLLCPRRIYVESDPFSAQVDVAQGVAETIEALDAHTHHFSFGENIGAADCAVPTGRYDWLPTRQPVALRLWAHDFPPGRAYTTITTWQNSNKHRRFNGEDYYWTKNREFERILDLPQRRAVPFQMATHLDEPTRRRLEGHGWEYAEAIRLSTDFDAYRRYIQQSRAEFTVARDQYVRPRTGWFSDRTATYLAAGRPVITQETAFSSLLPTGRGLFGFTGMDDVLAAVDAIESDYAGHCAAALDIAREYFAADRVLASLMDRAGA